jgi:aerobic-type carbon monoxide dehydrogenase small subunit (CoxS/CutS family)
MANTVEFILNGQSRRVTTDARRTLLEVLREDLDLTGTKYGCGEGRCRACTVLVDGQPMTSCQTTLDEVAGRKVETIEGLARGDQLHSVQQAFIEEDAMQCGYCVPGMILATVGLLRRNPKPSKDDMVSALNGNLCRCCGYGNILKAVERAAQPGTLRKEDR